MSALGPGCVKTPPPRPVAQHWNQRGVPGVLSLQNWNAARTNLAPLTAQNSFLTAWTQSGHSHSIPLVQKPSGHSFRSRRRSVTARHRQIPLVLARLEAEISDSLRLERPLTGRRNNKISRRCWNPATAPGCNPGYCGTKSNSHGQYDRPWLFP